jgi:arsenate reductase
VKLLPAVVSEFVGSFFLSAIVVGSGIAAQQLSPGQLGLELLENAGATAAGLYVLITVFGPVSGAHFNPLVSFLDVVVHRSSVRRAFAYLPAQIVGCSIGAMVANAMFALPAVTLSTHHRITGPHLLAEGVATAGLILVIFGLSRTGQSAKSAPAVACYIAAAYFFTSSTSFANPAIAIGRMLTNSFAGIAPSSVPLFIIVECGGAALALALLHLLFSERNTHDNS